MIKVLTIQSKVSFVNRKENQLLRTTNEPFFTFAVQTGLLQNSNCSLLVFSNCREDDEQFFAFINDTRKRRMPLFACNWIRVAKGLTEETYGNLVAAVTFNSIVAVPTIFLNTVIILAVVSKERLQTASHILLASLAAGIDLFWGLVAQPIAISIQMKKILDKGPFCDLEKVFTVLFTALGFTSVGPTSVSKYRPVHRYKTPFEIPTYCYQKDSKIRSSSELVRCSCYYSSANFVGSFRQRNETVFNLRQSKRIIVLVFVGVICLGMICYTYRYIFSETRRQIKQLKTEQLSDK